MEQNQEQQTHREEAGSGFCGAKFSARAVVDAVQEIGEQVEVSLMSMVPPAVSDHLVASQKELLKAGQRLSELVSEHGKTWAERAQANLERKAARAKEMHERNKAEKEAKAEGFKAEGI